MKQLQDAVERIKKSREMGSRYMIFQEMMQEEFEAGKAAGLKQGLKQGLEQGLERGRSAELIESILEMLRDVGTVDWQLEEAVRKHTDLEMLRKLFTLARKADSVEQFVLKMKEI